MELQKLELSWNSTDQEDSHIHPGGGPARQEATEAHLSPMDGVIQREAHTLANLERWRRRRTSGMVLALRPGRRRLPSSGKDA